MVADDTPRILITRLSHIGDCVLTMPLVSALRRALPNAYIAWATEKAAEPLIRRHPDLDEVIVVARRWIRSPAQIVSLRRQLRGRRFDISIDPQGLCKSAILGWLAGAPRRVGLASPLGRELSTLLNNELLRTTRPHVVDRTLQLLQALGVDDRHVDFGLRLPPDALQKVDQFLQSSAQTTFAVLNPGAIWPSKMWEMDRFGQVARHLHHELGVSSIVQWSGEREYRLAQDVIKAADRCAILAPETSLLQLAALLFRASLYIGGDTGPTHIAVAVGTPCIGLYGTTQPLQSGAYGPQNILLQRQYHGGTTRQRRHAANDCMRQISVRDVTRACDLLVERIRRPAGQQPAA